MLGIKYATEEKKLTLLLRCYKFSRIFLRIITDITVIIGIQNHRAVVYTKDMIRALIYMSTRYNSVSLEKKMPVTTTTEFNKAAVAS